MRSAMAVASFAATLFSRKGVVYRLRPVDCNAGAAVTEETTLFLAEDLDCDAACIDRAWPAGIERDVRDQPLQLGFRDAVVERPSHVAAHFVGAVERGEHGDGSEAAVALAEVGMLPHVAEQHPVAQVAPFRGGFA